MEPERMGSLRHYGKAQLARIPQKGLQWMSPVVRAFLGLITDQMFVVFGPVCDTQPL